MTEVAYRYEGVTYSPGADEYGDPLPGPGESSIFLFEYKIKRRTSKGYWVDDFTPTGKFVLLSANKRFACPTKQEALESFIARKQRQIRICKSTITQAEQQIKAAGKESEELQNG